MAGLRPSLTLVAMVKLAVEVGAGVKVNLAQQDVDVGDRLRWRSTPWTAS